MRYEAKLRPHELDLLRALVGREVDAVYAYGWDVVLRAGTAAMRFEPDDVPTPDASHPHASVHPIRVVCDDPARADPERGVVTDALGLVRSVSVLSVFVGFTPVEQAAAMILPIGSGVLLPAGEQYGEAFYSEAEFERTNGGAMLPDARVELDAGIEIVTEDARRLVVYTDGFFASAALDRLPDLPWATRGTFRRRPVTP